MKRVIVASPARKWTVLTRRVQDMAAVCLVNATVSQVGPAPFVMYPEPSVQISAMAMECTVLTQASAAVIPTGWALTAPRRCVQQIVAVMACVSEAFATVRRAGQAQAVTRDCVTHSV